MTDATAPAMTSHRPYLLRALWEWIADNGMTPHLLVDATRPGVRVPPHTIKDGKVVLNIADRAVARLEMGNDSVSFSARFAGASHSVVVPVPAILAIYARETGQGMALPEEMGGAPPPERQTQEGDQEAIESPAPDSPDDDGAPPPRRGAHLRVVK
jgi:stringent starvation protein B